MFRSFEVWIHLHAHASYLLGPDDEDAQTAAADLLSKVFRSRHNFWAGADLLQRRTFKSITLSHYFEGKGSL